MDFSVVLTSVLLFCFRWVWYSVQWVLVLAFWLVVALLFGVWWCQSLALYMPNSGGDSKKRSIGFNPVNYRSPAEYDMLFEDTYIRTTDNVRIHAWLIKQLESSKAPTVIFFHGNADIGYRLPLLKWMYSTVKCNILAVQYRGYGSSEGTASESGLVRDAEASLLWLHAKPSTEIDTSRIYLFGQSLGGGVAITTGTAYQDKVAGVIVENTFTSIDDMVIELARKLYNLTWIHYFRLFFSFYLTSHWSSVSRIPQLRRPILLLSGLRDELIPPHHMQSLYDAATGSTLRRLHTYANGSHNDTCQRAGDQYFCDVRSFINDVENASHIATNVASPRI